VKTLILYSSSSTFRPRSVVSSLSVDQRQEGHDVTVLDIGDFSYVTQDLPPAWFARIMGHRVHRRALETVFARNTIEYLRLRRSPIGASDLPEHVVRELDDAVFSELVTYLRTDKPDFTKWFTSYSARQLKQAATPLYEELRGFLNGRNFDRALIPNGRVPDQRMALLACQDSGVSVQYYEIGRARENSYYLGSAQVHDRDLTQAEVYPTTSHLSNAEVSGLAKEWLGTRMGSGLSIHPYNRNWDSKGTYNRATPSQNLTAVFFSSSVDEFASYGGSWKKHSWSDQYQAFEAILSHFSNKEIDCVLRIHPNLQNKSRSYVREELGRIRDLQVRFPALRVIGHMDRTNSYDLLEQADMIFVGRSTLGLEASALGKCVWTTTAARYDDIADVRRILNPSDITATYLDPWVVDPSGAQRFVAYWMIHDHLFRFGESEWSTWDSLKAPTRLRLGNLLVKNSLPHKVHLVLSEFSTWSNKKVVL